jgi:hypothetical protein
VGIPTSRKSGGTWGTYHEAFFMCTASPVRGCRDVTFYRLQTCAPSRQPFPTQQKFRNDTAFDI